VGVKDKLTNGLSLSGGQQQSCARPHGRGEARGDPVRRAVLGVGPISTAKIEELIDELKKTTRS
jgi:ABC-type phosphate transport system ATPase subunit